MLHVVLREYRGVHVPNSVTDFGGQTAAALRIASRYKPQGLLPLGVYKGPLLHKALTMQKMAMLSRHSNTEWTFA